MIDEAEIKSEVAILINEIFAPMGPEQFQFPPSQAVRSALEECYARGYNRGRRDQYAKDMTTTSEEV